MGSKMCRTTRLHSPQANHPKDRSARYCGCLAFLRDFHVMQYQFTPGAQRALNAAASWTSGEDCSELPAPAVLLGLAAESECRAAITLAVHGIDVEAVRRRWPELTRREDSGDRASDRLPRLSGEVELALQSACQRLGEYPRPLELATEHLLLGLVTAGGEVSDWLGQEGFDADALEAEVHRLWGRRPRQVPMQPPLPDVTSPQSHRTGRSSREAESIGPLRAFDAAANRAREGLRTVEDYVRFVLDDRHLTDRCKQLRHDLTAALKRISVEHRLAARETQADVGTTLATAAEQRRDTPGDVLTANVTRLQEALRSLEEFGKLLEVDMAAELKQLRYQAYTLQRAVEITRSSIERLAGARLYVLIDGRPSPEEFEGLARSLINAGVDVLQLRDKQLDDRRLLERARLLRDLTSGGKTLFIVNDRPDMAALAHADGVHVGQEECTVTDARTIVGPEALIGASTHSIAQARQAVLDGANYIGVGPTFPSGTKQFDAFPGLDLLRSVAVEIRLPAFAIGGVTCENVHEVLATGVTRVAVSGAITTADDPREATQEMLVALGE